mmetsp:Transcript_21341/g.34306  ORF Transcript_21341/g.34306 Transcript_21341/m.34306 type:complete len:825 (+) Transcript_21341:186-2660(+)
MFARFASFVLLTAFILTLCQCDKSTQRRLLQQQPATPLTTVIGGITYYLQPVPPPTPPPQPPAGSLIPSLVGTVATAAQCPPLSGKEQCLSAADSVISSTAGQVQCGVTGDCCRCASVQCDNCVVASFNGEYAAYGVQDIVINAIGFGRIACTGTMSCAATKMVSTSIVDLSCIAPDSCRDAEITINDPAMKLNIKCTARSSCEGMKITINYSNSLCGQAVTFGDLRCVGIDSCKNMQFTVNNNACDPMMIEEIQCIAGACTGTTWNFVGSAAVDVQRCVFAEAQSALLSPQNTALSTCFTPLTVTSVPVSPPPATTTVTVTSMPAPTSAGTAPVIPTIPATPSTTASLPVSLPPDIANGGYTIVPAPGGGYYIYVPPNASGVPPIVSPPVIPVASSTTAAPTTSTTTTPAPTVTTTLALQPGYQWGKFMQQCPVSTGSERCKSTSDKIEDSPTIECTEPADCCMCEKIVCGKPPGNSDWCESLQFGGVMAALGVKDIQVYSEDDTGLGVAKVECAGEQSCKDTNIVGTGVMELGCRGERSCMNAVVEITDPAQQFMLDCSTTSSCEGLQLTLHVENKNAICNTPRDVWQLGTIRCFGADACKNAKIVVLNHNDCVDVELHAIECMAGSCDGSSWLLGGTASVGVVDVDLCEVPSNVLTPINIGNGLNRCFANLITLNCADPNACAGQQRVLVDPMNGFKLECTVDNACTNAHFTIEVSGALKTVPTELISILCSSFEACKGMTVEVVNYNQLSALSVDVLCSGPSACDNAKFTTSQNAVIEPVRCSTNEHCINCVFNNGEACGGFPANLTPYVPAVVPAVVSV